VPHANWRGLYESGTVVGRSQCNIDIYLPYGEVVFMDSTGRRKVHPAIVMDQEGFELDTTQTRCIEIDFPGKAMGMRHLLRQNTVAGPISWMGSLVQDNQDASGLMYRRNRFYDPKSGRFTQEDPIGLAGGVNLYGFAAGDAVSYDDPYGLYVDFVGDRQAAIRYWNALYARAKAAESSGDPHIREAGRQILAMMVRMQNDTQTRYFISARRFFREEVRTYGHGYEGPWRSSSRLGEVSWEVNVNTAGPDPVRAMTHELGGAEASRHGRAHDEPSVRAEDRYRQVRNCRPRERHSNTAAPSCP
jgi:RHS repeat-associated protein